MQPLCLELIKLNKTGSNLWKLDWMVANQKINHQPMNDQGATRTVAEPNSCTFGELTFAYHWERTG